MRKRLLNLRERFVNLLERNADLLVSWMVPVLVLAADVIVRSGFVTLEPAQVPADMALLAFATLLFLFLDNVLWEKASGGRLVVQFVFAFFSLVLWLSVLRLIAAGLCGYAWGTGIGALLSACFVWSGLFRIAIAPSMPPRSGEGSDS